MKESYEESKTNVCKENDLMCIFKEVPNFLVEEEKEPWIHGSHHDVIRIQSGSFTEDKRKSTKPTVQFKPQEDLEPHKKTRKSTSNLPDGESRDEVLLWSSPFQSEYSLSHGQKKCLKTLGKYKWIMRKMISFDSMRVSENNSSFNLNDLCEECQDVVKLNQFSTSSTSLQNYDHLQSWLRANKRPSLTISLKTNGAKDSLEVMHAKSYNQSDVMKLLNEVQNCVLESCILLTTSKLHKKVKKLDRSVDMETPSDSDVLFEQIQAQEGSEEGMSKLCLALGRLVTKYLKIN